MGARWPRVALGAMWFRFTLGAMCPRSKANLGPNIISYWNPHGILVFFF
jgi:hypothetical protein